MPSFNWIEPDPLPMGLPTLHPDPLLHELLARRVRDADSAAEFLGASPRKAHDYAALLGLTDATERVAQAIETGERIAVYGDYDVDGITSTALLVKALSQATGDPNRIVHRLPTRKEGYGLNPTAIDDLAATGATLLIAVDCGSSDAANVALAKARGLDVVVLDHHQTNGVVLTDAVVASAQLNPPGPFQELTAVGVTYLLVAALADWGFRVDAAGLGPSVYLDLVALGTIADVAPLLRANRPLVRDGLRIIQTTPGPGILALCLRAGVNPETISSEQIAFKLAPRLNAAGRMADPRLALDLLMTDDPRNATARAHELEHLNARRRAESDRVVAEATAWIDQHADILQRRALVLARPHWGSGVLGLAAAKLVERYGMPVVVLQDDGQISRGSARSVPGFDIARALAASSDVLLAHGGHSRAAGVNLRSGNVEQFAANLDAAVLQAGIAPPGPASLQIDADMLADRLAIKTADVLEQLQPFGTGNPVPLLRIRNLTVRSYNTFGRDGSHLRLHLQVPNGITQAIAWGAAGRSRELVTRSAIDLLATIGIDHWQNQRRLHVDVKDFQSSR